jgi:hypothetical protein
MNLIIGDTLTLLEMLFVFILIISIYFLIAFICQAIGLYRVAGKLGKDNRWMAFIPILNMYLIGRCVDEEDPYILHAGWVATLVNIFMTIFVDNVYFVLFGSFLLAIATVYYIYQISIKLGLSGVAQAILTFFGFGPFVYLYLGLKEDKGKVVLEDNIKSKNKILTGAEIESASESKLEPEFDAKADTEANQKTNHSVEINNKKE